MAANKIAIATKQAPAAIGPYSQAIRAGGMVFTSGQVGLDPATGAIVPGGIKEQTARVKALLSEGGLGLADVVKTTVFLKDMGDFADLGINRFENKWIWKTDLEISGRAARKPDLRLLPEPLQYPRASAFSFRIA